MAVAPDPPARMTAEQLFRYDLPGKRTELLRGHLVVRNPAGFWHGVVALRLATALQLWLRENPLGVVSGNDPGFVLKRGPDTVRAPDVAFVRADRVPEAPDRGFAELAPDLAIEVRSRGDRTRALDAKVRQWLAAGTRLVWVIEPVQKRARVFRLDGSVATLGHHDVLDGEDVLPGFRLALREVT
ncbi:MAG: Uma2 family endonuclease [Gemmatimonadaceae bacterium]|nr:Uma2 family endonuclease [Gemmatimonadaceae bacterium]